jgi:hypothetical protein
MAWACIGVDRSKTDQQVDTEAPMKSCPFRAERIKAEAIKCKHCESMLADA